VRRGDLQIAISTGGASPALARRLRQEIEGTVGPEYAELVALLESLRGRIRAEIPDPRRRRAVFAELIDGDLLALIRKGDRSAIQARVEAIMRE
jgi:precorrin-2 dehydrogenase/sirohydrochlorin ferrochelatase